MDLIRFFFKKKNENQELDEEMELNRTTTLKKYKEEIYLDEDKELLTSTPYGQAPNDSLNQVLIEIALEERNAINKPSIELESQQIDYVLAYEKEESELYTLEDLNAINSLSNIKSANLREYKRKAFLINLQRQGLLVDQSYSTRKIQFVFIHTPNEQLCSAAERTRFKVPFEINRLQKENAISYFWHKIPNPFRLSTNIDRDLDRKYFTAPFKISLEKKFKKIVGDKTFSETIQPKDRSVLTYEFLSRTSYTKLIKPIDTDERKNEPETVLKMDEQNDAENQQQKVDQDDNRVGIERLIRTGLFTAAFPLHEALNKRTIVELDESNTRQKLWEYWARINCRNLFSYQPMNLIREYFGEKVAFYFSWLGFYTTWLFVPSIIGIIVFVYGLVTLPYDIPTNEICNINKMGNTTMCRLCSNIDDDDDHCHEWRLIDSCLYAKITHVIDNGATVFFSIVMAIWTVLFIEFWKRQQNTYQFEWDIIDYETNDVTRPEYEASVKKKKPNMFTGKEEPYVPLYEKVFKYCTSIAAVLFMLCLVLILVVSIITYRVSIFIALSRHREWRSYSNYVASSTAAMINLAIILILNRIYNWLALKLTDLETHRTDSSYESSFTVKIYLFQFFNFYSSIFYIAFFKGRLNNIDNSGDKWYLEPCDPSGCLVELCIQLAIIMIGKQINNNIQELLYPKFLRCMRSSKKTKERIQNEKTKEKAQCLKDYVLIDWTIMSLFDEYLEMVIQFGFITLFVVAFPLGPLFAFINNILEIRIDAYKFLVQMKRPLAKKSLNIGIWLNIINTVSKIGVITNGLIIAFTSEFIPRLVYLLYKEQSNLTGFVDFTLSSKLIEDISSSRNHTSTDYCQYRDFRAGPEEGYKHTIDYYHVLVARLIFFVCFEHVTFFVVTCLHWIIRDVPAVIQAQIDHEHSKFQQAVWESPLNN